MEFPKPEKKTCAYDKCTGRPKSGDLYCWRHKKHVISKVRKKTKAEVVSGISQSELFDKIWADRPHMSQISGEWLYDKGQAHLGGSDLYYRQFMHVLGKKAYPDFITFEYNIVLGTHYEHDQYDNKGVSDMKGHSGWEWLLELKEALKTHYNVRSEYTLKEVIRIFNQNH